MTIAYNTKPEHPMKPSAREHMFAAWGKNAIIGNKNYLTGLHVVIASRNCGDIQYHLANGVPKENIFACDIDEQACYNALDYLPMGNVHFGKISQLVRLVALKVATKERPLVSIAADFCSTIQTHAEEIKAIKCYAHLDTEIRVVTSMRLNKAKRENLLNQVLGPRFKEGTYRGYGPMQIDAFTLRHQSPSVQAAIKAWATRKRNAALRAASKAQNES